MEIAPTKKKWYKSKTFWTNVVVVILGILEAAGIVESRGMTTFAAGLGNVGLRAITKSALTR
jgi:hypothetical protein